MFSCDMVFRLANFVSVQFLFYKGFINNADML